MKQSVAELLGLPSLRFANQAQALEEGDQVLCGEHQLHPDLVGQEVLEWEVAEAGVLGATNAVLDSGVSAMTNLEGDDVGVALVGDEDLEAISLMVCESELCSGMGPLAPTDRARPSRPRAQVEAGQLTDASALMFLSSLAEGDEAAVVLRRHAEHYLDVARRADPELRHGDRVGALRRLRLEHANFQAAMEWVRSQPGEFAVRLATALGRYWELSGSITEGSAWLDEALAIGTGDPVLWSTGLLRAGRLAFIRGDYDRADACLAESLQLKRDQGDEAGVARRMNAMAAVALARGDTGEVERLSGEALGIMRRLEDQHGIAWAHTFLGSHCSRRHGPQRAEPARGREAPS